jgi:hypothetical protein
MSQCGKGRHGPQSRLHNPSGQRKLSSLFGCAHDVGTETGCFLSRPVSETRMLQGCFSVFMEEWMRALSFADHASIPRCAFSFHSGIALSDSLLLWRLTDESLSIAHKEHFDAALESFGCRP